MSQINILKQMYIDFMSILNQSVIKYSIQAEKYETLESKKEADGYMNAYLQEDKFETYYRYERSIIAKVFGLDEVKDSDQIDVYYYDRKQIPYAYRDTILKRQRKYIIEHYEEKNNYYRMLNGLPDLEDTNYFYLPGYLRKAYYIDLYEDERESGEVDDTKDGQTPIHLLDESVISLLQSINYISSLYESSKKEYLKYLGKFKIDIVTSRTAKNFALIRIPNDVSQIMLNEITLIYEQCREYYMSCIYIKEYRQTMPYYDNFIAMCIMIMTIIQVISRVLKDTIDRSFFDEYCVRTLFSVYGVPYYGYMEESIKLQIMQDLNLLIQNKGTNQVLYDIASILGYDRLKIYKYYLVKSRKFDTDNNPITYYKTDPSTGEQILDIKNMYDIYFQKVELNDMDTYKSMLSSMNKVSYDEITRSDPLWVEDDELLKEIYEAEYNFAETKYMGLSVSYKLTRVLFENVYLLKMLFDKKSEISDIFISIPKIMTSDISLFDTVVTLCAMVCKVNKLKGNILVDPSKILHVLGFNFETDFEAIRKDIIENPDLDDSLLKYFVNLRSYTAEEVNNLYLNFYDLYNELVDRLSNAITIEAYEAYHKLYKTIFFADENQRMFNIGTDAEPQYASTFLEYLQYKNTEMYNIINEGTEETLVPMIDHICVRIMKVIPDLAYLGTISGRSEQMEQMLLTLVRFFKSYTTDIIKLSIIYIFEMKPELLIKFIDKMYLTVNIRPEDDLKLSYGDHIVEITSKFSLIDHLKLLDKIQKLSVGIQIFDRYRFEDCIKYIHNRILMNDTELNFTDIIQNFHTSMKLKSNQLYLKDFIDINSDTFLSDIYRFKDKITEIHLNEFLPDSFTLWDNLEFIHINSFIADRYNFRDKLHYLLESLWLQDYNKFKDDIVSITTKRDIETLCQFYDLLDLVSSIYYSHSISFIDKLYEFTQTTHLSDSIIIKDMLKALTYIIKLSSNISFVETIDVTELVPVSDSITFKDILVNLTKDIYLEDYNKIKDELIHLSSNAVMTDTASFHDAIILPSRSFELSTHLYFLDKLKSLLDTLYVNEPHFYKDLISYLHTDLCIHDSHGFYDTLSYDKNFSMKDSYGFQDKIFISYSDNENI